MAIISSDDITLTRVDDGDDGYSPQVTVTQNVQDTDSVDINVEVKNNQTGVITTNTTTIKKADRVYTALQDVSVFNQLTNGGELQGMFTDESGHAYFNGQYLRAEGADIGGWKIQSKLMYTYADKSYQVEEGDEIVEEIGRRFTVINGEAEFYDTYNAATVNTYQTLYEGLSPATPAFAAGIDGVMPSEWDEATQSYVYHDYELGDINTARVKIMHDGSIYAGRYSASNALGYDYNFKVDDEKLIIGKNGNYVELKSLIDVFPGLSNDGVLLSANTGFGVYTPDATMVLNSGTDIISTAATYNTVQGKCIFLNQQYPEGDYNTSILLGSIGGGVGMTVQFDSYKKVRFTNDDIKYILGPLSGSSSITHGYERSLIKNPSAICDWGTYSSIGTTVTLREDYRKYRFLIIRFGTEETNPTIGGVSLMTIPTSLIGSTTAQFQHSWYQGTALQGLKFCFPSTTSLEIVGRSGNKSGIRQILGYS